MMPKARHTKSRQAVLRAVKLSPQAISAEQVLKQVNSWWPEANQASAYRNLDWLTKRGEIYRVEGEDGIKRYIGHAFHEARFRCQRCGETHELSKTIVPDLVKQKAFGRRTVFFLA